MRNGRQLGGHFQLSEELSLLLSDAVISGDLMAARSLPFYYFDGTIDAYFKQILDKHLHFLPQLQTAQNLRLHPGDECIGRLTF